MSEVSICQERYFIASRNGAVLRAMSAEAFQEEVLI